MCMTVEGSCAVSGLGGPARLHESDFGKPIAWRHRTLLTLEDLFVHRIMLIIFAQPEFKHFGGSSSMLATSTLIIVLLLSV